MKLIEINQDEFKELYKSNNNLDLSIRYNTSEQSIYIWAKRLGINKTRVHSNKMLTKRRRWTNEEVAILTYWANTPSLSTEYIMKVLNRSKSSIRGACTSRKIRIRLRGKDGVYKDNGGR